MTDATLTNNACRTHAKLLVDTVINNLQQRDGAIVVEKALKLEKLRRLWNSNLDDGGMKEFSASVGSHAHTVTPLAKHPRLIQPIPPLLTSVCGFIGTPAAQMQRPAYPASLAKPDRHSKQKKRTLNAVAPPMGCEGLPETAEEEELPCDLLIGAAVEVDLPGLLRSQKRNVLNSHDDMPLHKWVPARVVSIDIVGKQVPGLRRRLTVKVRFRSGAEIEVRWPDSTHIRSGTGRSGEQPVTGAVVGHGVGGAAVGGGEGGLAGGKRRKRRTAEEALRILLSGDAEEGVVDAFLDADWGADSDSDADEESGNEAEGAGTEETLLPHRSMEAVTGAGRELFAGGRRSGGDDTALLATGERVLASQLSEIERIFAPSYRPRWLLVPAQRLVPELAGASRRASFVSRRWGGSAAAVVGVDGAQDDHSGVADGGGHGLKAELSEHEDPTAPLPEPEVVVIGRAAKKLLRGEERWTTLLQDVYVRDLRGSCDCIVPHFRLDLGTKQALFPPAGDPQECENDALLLAALR